MPVASRVLVAVGLLLVALNLRPAVATVGPLLSSLRADTGLGGVGAGVLTALPVACFGLIAFLTPRLLAHVALRDLVAVALAVLVLGVALRSVPGMPALFVGTLVLGAAIAVGNVLIPVGVKAWLPESVGLMMGLYATLLAVGAAVASGVAVPLARTTDSWRLPLGVWCFPAVIALAVWLLTTKRSARQSPAPGGQERRVFWHVLQDRSALAVTAYMGLQSTSYYALLSWAPTLLQDAGVSESRAGWLLAFSNVPAVIASLVTPTVAQRLLLPWLPAVAAVGCCGGAYLGLALAPTSIPLLWMGLLGVGQGASISLALSAVVWHSRDIVHAGELSTVAQGCGYLLAALGPALLGVAHSVSGGWGLALTALGALLVAQAWTGMIAAPPRRRISAVAGRSRRDTARPRR